MDKRFLAILGTIIVIFIAIFIVTSSGDDNGKSERTTQKPTSHIQGEGKAGVTLMEYGDYQCNVCLAYEPTLKQVIAKHKQDIYFQFRNLPLTSHQNAFAAARVAEAAALQNKFWEMHDILYNPTNWSTWTASNNATELFNQYAKELSLNIEKFKTDFASSQVNNAIRADIAAFNKTGQSMATPTFFIDGRYVPNKDLVGSDGAPSVERFTAVINDAIKQKQ